MLRAAITLLVVVVVAAVAVVVTAPATWVGHRVAAATGNALTIVDARGTLWNGKGTLGSGDGRWRVPIAWRFDSVRLLHGELVFVLEPMRGLDIPRGTLSLGGGGLRAAGVALVLPASVIETAAAGAAAFVAGGNLVVDVPAIELAQDRATGNGKVQWERARVIVQNGPTLALGTVNATFSPQPGGLAGKLANDGGELAIAGTLELRPNEAIVNATFVPQPGARPEVARALAGLGNPDASGAVRVGWRMARR